jgi:hypothetical protein
MIGSIEDPADALVLRIWVEEGPPKAFRSRLLEIDEDRPGGRTVGVAASPEETCRLVRRWIDRRLAESPEP